MAGVADTAITIAYWEMEANPLTLALGPVVWVLVKLGVLAVGSYLWTDVRDHMAAQAVVLATCLLYVLVLVLNVGAVTGKL